MSGVRVMIWPAGDENDGTSQARLYQPGYALKDQGADVVVNTAGPTLLWDREWHGTQPPPDARVMALAAKPAADVIVMQRPGRRWWADVIPMLQEVGIRVVVDVDDLFTHIHQRNAAHAGFDPRRNAVHNYEWVAEACRRADLVTCTTPVLREAYGFGHGLVIPNFVPEHYLEMEVPKRERTMGWSGTVASHPDDLLETRGAVPKALAQFAWGFHHIGNPQGVRQALKLAEEPTSTGWIPFSGYADQLGELSLGIVPLEQSRFNNAKSALKSMEMAALGVPAAVSPTWDNKRMADEGVGEVVTYPTHWRRVLPALMGNDEYRAEVAGRGRAAMAQFTYEKQCWRWAFAWGLDREKAAAGVL